MQFVIPGLSEGEPGLRDEAEANIGEADGPKRLPRTCSGGERGKS